MSSAVAPEWEMRRRASHGAEGEQGQTTPRSPWRASRGWRKTDWMPREQNVATIFLPAMPLLPTPVTMILPCGGNVPNASTTALKAMLLLDS